MLGVVLETMKEMQRENLREIRGIVGDILQGRPMDERQIEAMRLAAASESQPSRTPFDPPDYDREETDDLPGGLQSVFERERMEQDDVRKLRTEQEVLASQLDEARAALTDPQGIGSVVSSSMD
jgi:hypothetical protein